MSTITKDNDRKNVKFFLFLCWFCYTISYVGRLNYNASMVEIIGSLNIDRADAGLVSTCFFIAYGVGQLVNGLLCQKYNSRLMIGLALTASSVMNIIMGFVPNIYAMCVVWTINGAAQSILWSSIIKMQSEYVPDDMMPKVIILMSTTVAVGTFGAYGISALCIYLNIWQATFYASFALLAVAAVCWFVGIGKFEKFAHKIQIKNVAEVMPNKGKLRFTLPVFICFLAIAGAGLANGFVKDGINTWVPNILSELYSMPNYFAVLLTLVLPLISVIGSAVCQWMNKFIKDQVIIYALMFIVSAICILVIYLVPTSMILTLVMFTIVVTAMAGADNVLTSAIPLEMRSFGSSGTIAGLINTFCRIGAAIAMYTLGLLADRSGNWTSVILVLLLSAGIIGLISIPIAPLWRKNIFNKAELDKVK